MARASSSGVDAGSLTFCSSASSRIVRRRSEPSRWQWRSVLGSARSSSSVTGGSGPCGIGPVWSRFAIGCDHKARRPPIAALSPRGMLAHLAAFLVRLPLPAAVLMLAVGWVTPRNPGNTFARAVVVSAFLSAAWYLTLARFLWFLVVPWLLYVAIWLVTVMAAYDMGFLRALLLAVALAFL